MAEFTNISNPNISVHFQYFQLCYTVIPGAPAVLCTNIVLYYTIFIASVFADTASTQGGGGGGRGRSERFCKLSVSMSA